LATVRVIPVHCASFAPPSGCITARVDRAASQSGQLRSGR
jgi:hypothetical protein